jgi:hypothetical protein
MDDVGGGMFLVACQRDQDFARLRSIYEASVARMSEAKSGNLLQADYFRNDQPI